MASANRINPVKLGLALGAFAVAMTIALMLVFARHGLPKDPKEWRRIEQQRSAMEAR
jgi:hypothetical protein